MSVVNVAIVLVVHSCRVTICAQLVPQMSLKWDCQARQCVAVKRCLFDGRLVRLAVRASCIDPAGLQEARRWRRFFRCQNRSLNQIL